MFPGNSIQMFLNVCGNHLALILALEKNLNITPQRLNKIEEPTTTDSDIYKSHTTSTWWLGNKCSGHRENR
jgi:hypothetical protein